MVLAIGLVVDDAIVVVENIHRHLEEGKTPVQASLQGAREIVGPVISMTHHAGGRVRADRLPRRPHRFAVPRIRLHAGGLGDRVGRDRADAVADDVLGLPQERGRGTVRQDRQQGVRRDDALVRPAARPFARLSSDHRTVRADDPRHWSASSICTPPRNSRPRKIRASCSR